jgi:hypothetical protein
VQLVLQLIMALLQLLLTLLHYLLYQNHIFNLLLLQLFLLSLQVCLFTLK